MKYYKRNYKYELAEDLELNTGIRPRRTIQLGHITLDKNGTLMLRKGYLWDGPSGPTVDTEDSMRGSAGHDALYELIKQGLIAEHWYPQANKDLLRWLKEDGMWWWRRRLWYRAVEVFGEAYSSREGNDDQVFEA